MSDTAPTNAPQPQVIQPTPQQAPMTPVEMGGGQIVNHDEKLINGVSNALNSANLGNNPTALNPQPDYILNAITTTHDTKYKELKQSKVNTPDSFRDHPLPDEIDNLAVALGLSNRTVHQTKSEEFVQNAQDKSQKLIEHNSQTNQPKVGFVTKFMSLFSHKEEQEPVQTPPPAQIPQTQVAPEFPKAA